MNNMINFQKTEIDTGLLLKLPLPELIKQANEVRREYAGEGIELCNILNAKSGLCSEDCKFCAQSSHYFTHSPAYPLKSKAEIIEAAKQAKEIGAHRFDIVCSGNNLNQQEVDIIAGCIKEIVNNIGIKMCASLGALSKKQLTILKQAGLERYHHNIETSRRFYPQIVSTHTFEERIKTIKSAKETGLQVCSGGIIGIGEDWQDRIDMAYILRELDVDSVPINVLVPIKGTPLERAESISCSDVVRTICIFRIILKDKLIKIAAGRESVLKDFQAMGFMAGANGMLIGGYLTIKGRDVSADMKLVEEVKTLWKG